MFGGIGPAMRAMGGQIRTCLAASAGRCVRWAATCSAWSAVTLLGAKVEQQTARFAVGRQVGQGEFATHNPGSSPTL